MKLHPLQQTLIELGISSENSFEHFFSRTRDNSDVQVLRCRNSGAIVLSQIGHMSIEHYENQAEYGRWSIDQREHAIREFRADDLRRAEMIRSHVTNKRWIDVGTETGGILRILKGEAELAIGVEPKRDARNLVEKEGFLCYPLLDNVGRTDIDVVTLFHVFEHLIDPLQVLAESWRVLTSGGLIVIEVPHARDFLINRIDLDAFKAFTFWSEHLILHTRQSLTRFVEHAGFRDISVRGFQRYPLSNHLHWLRHNKPGGHIIWSDIDTPELRAAYQNALCQLDQTDTIVLTARKP